MGLTRVALVAVVAILAPTLGAAAQESGTCRDVGADGWSVTVPAGEVMRLTGAKATLCPHGVLQVDGTLILEGTPNAEAQLTNVTILLRGEGPHRLAHARLTAPEGVTPLVVGGGSVVVENATFDGLTTAIHASADASVHVVDAAFLRQEEPAILVEGAAGLRAARVNLLGPGEGIRYEATGALDVADATFRGRATHVAIEGAPRSATIVDSSFGPGATGLLIDAANASSATIERNRFRGLDVGLDARGAGVVVDATANTFLDNGIAVRARDGARVVVQEGIFSNNAQHVAGDVDVDDATTTFLPAQGLATPTSGADAPPALDDGAPGAEIAAGPPLDANVTTTALVAVVALGALALAAGYAARAPLARLARRIRIHALPASWRAEARARIEDTLEGANSMPADDLARKAGLGPELTAALLDEMASEGRLQRRPAPNGAQPRYRLAAPDAAPDAPEPDLDAPLRPQEARVLRDMLDHPGTPQSAVAQRLGLTRQALHYHVKKLEGRGLITKVAKGRETHCFVRPEAEALLARAPREEAVAPSGDATTV